MKKTFLCFIATLLILISGISLVGCDMGTGTPAIPDYNADVQDDYKLISSKPFATL